MDYTPILISLKTAFSSIFITFFAGIFTARAVVGLRCERLKAILDSLLTLPQMLPPTVAGFLLLYLFGQKRPVGCFFLEAFGVKIAFSWAATVIAAVVISFPLMYRAARGAFEQVDVTLLQAARTLGMGECVIFWRIVMPLSLPGVASGGVLAFARGMGEFGATALLAGNIAGRTRTLPIAVYSEVSAGNMNAAWVYVAAILLISFSVVGLINWATAKSQRWRGRGPTR